MKIKAEAVFKVLEYAFIAVHGIIKEFKKDADNEKKKEQLCLKIVT